jgi:2-phospho-L-lactate/phosphoenolpyruvate guanylyltransferase
LTRTDSTSLENVMMNLIVLIPCKDLDRGKSRLAGVLSPRSRRALCEFFLCRTLDVATRAFGAARVRVVTSDPRVAAIAAEYGAGAVPDGGADLNGALEHGRAHVMAETGDCAGLILPIDLPLATPESLAGVAEAPHVIVPDESADGTNVLRLAPAAFRTFRFAFGPHSFTAHRAHAGALGLDVRIVKDPLLMFDVDTPEQYRRWAEVTDHPL